MTNVSKGPRRTFVSLTAKAQMWRSSLVPIDEAYGNKPPKQTAASEII